MAGGADVGGALRSCFRLRAPGANGHSSDVEKCVDECGELIGSTEIQSILLNTFIAKFRPFEALTYSLNDST